MDNFLFVSQVMDMKANYFYKMFHLKLNEINEKFHDKNADFFFNVSICLKIRQNVIELNCPMYLFTFMHMYTYQAFLYPSCEIIHQS